MVATPKSRKGLPPSQKPCFTRRRFLQGSGAVIALPFLHSLMPRAAWSATMVPPVRLLSYYVPLGMMMDAWVPSSTGSNYPLSPTLQPLAAVKANFAVITNLDNNIPNSPGNGGGHAKGTGQFATASRIASYDARPQVAISFDQVVAQAMAGSTRLSSMQMGCFDSPFGDGAYPSAYTAGTSWSSPTTPLPPVYSPVTVFNRLFPNGQVQGKLAERALLTPGRLVRPSVQKSILDGALAQTQSLQKQLSRSDAEVLDQYLTGIREAEAALGDVSESPSTGAATGTGAGMGGNAGGGTAGNANATIGTGTGSGTAGGSAGSAAAGGATTVGVAPGACVVPQAFAAPDNNDYDAQFNRYAQLIPLAFQCDQTRVISFMFACGESYRVYRALGATAGHHAISHYNAGEAGLNSASAIALLKKIQFYEMQCFAKLLGNMRDIRESNGSLLDNSVVLFSTELTDSQNHTYDNMPVILAGGGGGRLKGQGQHVACARGTRYAQVLLTAMRACGVSVASFGSSGETSSVAGML